MADLMQQARELLAKEFPPSDPRRAALLRGGTAMDLQYGLTLRAIAAALRAAPEGLVLVPVEPTEEMKRAGSAHVSNPYGLARDVWAAMLAARPQGVKDGR